MELQVVIEIKVKVHLIDVIIFKYKWLCGWNKKESGGGKRSFMQEFYIRWRFFVKIFAQLEGLSYLCRRKRGLAHD